MPGKIPPRRELAEEYLSKAISREVEGLATYGDFVPQTDTRVLSSEAIDECVDILNYMRFYEKKYGKSIEVTAIKRLAFKLYVELRRLELEETRKKGGGA